MSDSANVKSRPTSPFMIGPYYRPQLTSMLSITHRITGLFLWLGSLFLLCWLVALAAGPELYAQFRMLTGNILGKLLGFGFVWSLFFHLFNGIRHLFWDAGRGLEIKTAYVSGWTVLISSIAGAILFWIFGGAQ